MSWLLLEDNLKILLVNCDCPSSSWQSWKRLYLGRYTCYLTNIKAPHNLCTCYSKIAECIFKVTHFPKVNRCNTRQRTLARIFVRSSKNSGNEKENLHFARYNKL